MHYNLAGISGSTLHTHPGSVIPTSAVTEALQVPTQRGRLIAPSLRSYEGASLSPKTLGAPRTFPHGLPPTPSSHRAPDTGLGPLLSPPPVQGSDSLVCGRKGSLGNLRRSPLGAHAAEQLGWGPV